MNSGEINRLKFRRQYILGPSGFDCPYIHNTFDLVNNYCLYAHIDLNVTDLSKDSLRLILLGDIFDFESPRKNNIDILNDLADTDFNRVVEKSAKYSGRYVIIHIYKESISLFHDATATRKIYYCSLKNVYWCASQPFLLSKALGLKKTLNKSKLDFYSSPEFEKMANSNIGNTTIFDEISQLLPNHYLNITKSEIKRYWPNKKIEYLPLEEVSQMVAKMIKGFVESIGHRYSIMMPITAGKDSRALLAASRDICKDVFYYINKESNLNENSIDISVPKRMLGKLGLDFHIVDPYIEIDKDFEKLYFENNESALPKYLPIIYNYYLNYSDKINMPGVFVASAYEVYGSYDKKLKPNILARLNGVDKYTYAVDYYENWLLQAKELCSQNNLNIFVLFYWEERLANWGTQIQLLKDIAQEDFVPYNSRQLIQYCFSVPPIQNNKPNNTLSKSIIKNLWPETLNDPLNPNFKQSLYSTLARLKVIEPLKKIKFILTHYTFGI
jgi:hypothetical protein